MRTEIKKNMAVFLLLGLFCLLLTPLLPAQQETSEPEKIHPGPRDIKEKSRIQVFIVWLWISIIVLGIFLRLKIKEVDRLFKLKFFNSPQGRKFINPDNQRSD